MQVRRSLHSDGIVIITDRRTDRNSSNVFVFRADQMSPRCYKRIDKNNIASMTTVEKSAKERNCLYRICRKLEATLKNQVRSSVIERENYYDQLEFLRQ